jgi:hypothetical protein
MSESKKWIITLSDNRSTGDVKKQLSAMGFSIDEVLEDIGCIIGTASSEIAKQARSIAGVADVSQDHPPIDIGSPDKPVTW